LKVSVGEKVMVHILPNQLSGTPQSGPTKPDA
jgi:hypothetical protein